jgi:hypothetical protein
MNIKIAMVLALVGIMTVCLVVTKPLANQAFAQIPCDLTLKANPGSVAPAPAKGQPEDLTGKLICGGAGYSGADIRLSVVPSASGSWAVDVNTDSSGNFEFTQHSGPGPGLVVQTPESYIITAKYAGDPDHMDGEHKAATASITITTTIEHHKT